MKVLPRGFRLNFWLSVFIIVLAYFPVSAQDFSTITWGTAAGQPASTHEVHGDVVNGKLYIFGGYDVSKLPSYSPTKRAFVYDPVTNQWAPIADLPHNPNGAGFGGITHVGLTTDGTDIYFAGGYPSNSTGTGQTFGTREVWKYNVASNTYTRFPDLPQLLAGGQLRYLNGRIHYIGGTNISRADVGVHYVLDLNNVTGGWSALASLSDPRNHAAAAVYGGKIYSIGGSHHQDASAVTQKTVEIYDPATNTWTRGADLPVARDHISSAIVVIGNRIVVLGGETSHNVTSSLVSAYSPASNSWTALTQLPASRAAGVAAVLNGNIHYTGGNFGKTNYKGIPVIQNTTKKTLLPMADAFVRNGSFAGTNYGSDASLLVKGTTAVGYSRSAYLKFSLGTLTNINSARLRVYGRNIENTSGITLSAFGIDNDSWAESTITFNNAPSSSAPVLNSVGVTDLAQYYEIDVTNYVTAQLAGDKVVSLLINNPSNQNRALSFNSKENSLNPPELVIEVPADGIPGNALAPLADAYVRNGTYGSANFGSDVSLNVKGTTTASYARSSYLKFSLSALTDVNSARLRIYGNNVENTSSITLSAFGIDDDSWAESTITFNTAPTSLAPALSSVGVNNVAKYYEFDVTDYVKTQFAGDKVVSFLVKDAANQNRMVAFNSKENANNKPQLVVVSSATLSNSITGNILEAENDFRTPIAYPNPVKNRFNLMFPEHHEGDFSLDIVDLSGRIYNIRRVYVPHEGSDIDVDISKFFLRPGVYFLRIKSISRIEKIKLILK